MVQPPRGFGENPVAIYHDPDLPPSHHYLAAYHWLDNDFGADAVVHLGKHGNLEWLPGKTLGMSAACGSDAALGRSAADLPVPRQRPGRGHPGQAARARHTGRPPHPADGPRRNLRRHRAIGAVARRARQHRGARPRQAARDPPADLDADARRRRWTTTSAWRNVPRTTRSTTCCCTSTAGCARSRTCRSATGCTSSARRRPASPSSTWCWPSCGRASCSAASRRCPGLRQALGLAEDGSDERVAVDEAETRARALLAELQQAGWDAAVVDDLTDERDVAAILRFAATEVVPRLAGTAGEIDQILRALDGRFIAAGPSGSPLRGPGQRAADRAQLLLRRPQGRAVAAGLGNR